MGNANPATKRAAIVEKLHPTRIACSGRFTAMLAYILGEQWTDPAIVDMVITSDGMLLVGSEYDPLDDEFVGDSADLWANLEGVAQTAGLTAREQRSLMDMAEQQVRRA